MSKKPVYIALSVVLIMIVASISFVITVGPRVSASSTDPILIDNNYLNIDDNGVLSGFTTEGRNYVRLINSYKIILPSNVKSIGESAFSYCTGLVNITLNKGLTRIEDYAFQETGLTSITIPSSVVYISSTSFITNVLESIHVDYGNSIYTSGYDRGIGVSQLEFQGILRKSDNCLIVGCKNTYMGGVVEKIGTYAFYGVSRQNAGIPQGIKEIGAYAFANCRDLKEVNLPDTVESISAGAFANCRSLTSITLPQKVTSIFPQAFDNCISLTNVTFSGAVDSIRAQAFMGCTKLTNIILPSTVTSIGGQAFMNCTSLTSIRIPYGVSSIDGDVFKGCSNLKIFVENATLKNNANLQVYGDNVIVVTSTVTFNSNGGTSVDEQKVNFNEKATKPTDPTKTGYTFECWCSDETLDSVYNFNTPITNDITLYAKWRINQYTVTFNSNGGSEVGAQTIEHGSIATEPVSTKAGYAVEYWYYLDDGSNEVRFDFNTPITDNIELTAHWLPTFSITFDTQGGGVVEGQTIKQGYNVTKPNPTKAGYAVEYWYYLDDGSNEVRFDFNTPITGSIELKAKWIKTYTVMFNSKGGSSVADQIINQNGMATNTIPNRKGYTFLGWYKDANYQEEYDFTTEVSDNFTLYAKWEPNPEESNSDIRNIIMVAVIAVVACVIMGSFVILITKKH